MLVSPQAFTQDYFSANTSIDRGWVKSGLLAALRTLQDPQKHNEARTHEPGGALAAAQKLSNSGRRSGELSESTAQVGAVAVERLSPVEAPVAGVPPAPSSDVLPHRRRKRAREDSKNTDPVIPPDASSQLTTAAANLPSSASLRRTLATYLSLTKPRLSFLIVLTPTTAYPLYPIPDILSSTSSLASETLSTSTLTLLFLTTGTFLSCAAANTLNMLMEPKYDAQMSRTRNRPLVRKLVTPTAAGLFALVTGVAGLTLLDLGTNSTVAFLSALNIFLYAGVYTPMKRISVLNTWVGALVGGIPPLMGWAAAAGQAATSEHHSWTDLLFSEDSLGGWLLAGLLFAWQFPHFNAIAHGVRNEYRNAGYRMMAWTNPARAGRVAVRYSLAMFPICAGFWWAGIVNGGFMVISTVCNAWMTKEAFKFWRRGGAGGSARSLFWASVWQLPLVMVGALVCKKGIWEGFWEKENVEVKAEAMFDDGLGSNGSNEGPVLDTEREKQKAVPHDINLAMLGFKRPS
jgi:heme o synthase